MYLGPHQYLCTFTQYKKNVNVCAIINIKFVFICIYVRYSTKLLRSNLKKQTLKFFEAAYEVIKK